MALNLNDIFTKACFVFAHEGASIGTISIAIFSVDCTGIVYIGPPLGPTTPDDCIAIDTNVVGHTGNPNGA